MLVIFTNNFTFNTLFLLNQGTYGHPN